jgi:2-O-methyltransferase
MTRLGALVDVMRRLNPRERQGMVSLAEIAAHLPPAPVVIEAGAHIGVDTVRLARKWPEGRIYAFEPVPEVFRKLQERVSRLPNASCFQLALGGQDGTAEIHLSGGASDGSSSLLKPKEHLRDHPDVTFDRTTSVTVRTVDSWAAEHGVDRVDFLWLDMQGLELQVLQAAPVTLATVSAIYSEVSLRETYEGAALYPELAKWLEKAGFTIAVERLPWKDMGNVLFVRS